ncbi:lectin, mannose-binding 2-like b precursor [Silurus meridionalis]|nr:lectin, mannose-binding 2-like b precursor [Silurus meridionalis]
MAAPTNGCEKISAVYFEFLHFTLCALRHAKVYFPLVFLLALTALCTGNDDFQRDEFLKREYSLAKPYQGLGSSSSSHWDLLGNAMITPEYVRLTPDLQSRQGAVWSRIPFYIRDWELQVHFKIHGKGKKNLNGDGLALWLTRDRMQTGMFFFCPVFGNINHFTGLGIFIDTYPNHDNQHERSFPFISAMVGNGSVAYEHDRDGRNADLGGCQAAVRNVEHETSVLIRYMKSTLTVMMDVEGKQEWRDCVEVPGVHLPQGYYFGASSLTGDLSDNHDLISLKLFELTVERTLEELENEQEVTVPSVDHREIPVEVVDKGMSTLTLLFLFIVSVVGFVAVVVAFIFIYARWKERSRKRFY